MTVRKRIITPSQSALLVPHWYELDEEKLERLGSIPTKQLKLPGGGREVVLACPPIVIDPTGYLVNGKHRAVMSVSRRQNLEAIVVETPNDVRHHVPKESYGPDEGDGPAKLIEALANKNTYLNAIHAQGVYTVRDLVVKYLAFPKEKLSKSF